VDRQRLVGAGFVVLSALAFGAGGVFAKPAYAAGLDWQTLLTWRFAIGAALAWLALLIQPGGRRALRALPRRTVAIAIALGVLYVGNAGTYYAALETVPLSLATIIVFVYPAFVAVLTLFFGRAPEGLRAWGALGLAVAGMLLTVGGIDPSAKVPLQGLLLVLASPVIYSVWIMLSARVGGERKDRAASEGDGSGAGAQEYGALAMTATAVAFTVLAVVSGSRFAPGDIPAAAWIPLLGIGVISTFVSILTFYEGTRRVGAAQASLISTVEPVWTVALAALILGERLQPLQLLGGAVILTAVIVAQTSRGSRTTGVADAGPAVPTPAAADDRS
jgi:drug/metabolite transporter (DMT)-like permease